jgi:tetratricopeptide (TPR) repeat protein
MPHQPKVIISSTARDLPEHRKEVMDACLRQGMFPDMMEHLPASDAEAISASLKLVDEADIYVGVFAHRYGYVPKENNPRQISITEMEYDRAFERKIPRLIFIIDKNHPLADFTINDIDTGESAVKLAQFKSRIETENIPNFFKSPEDLRAHVINSLSQQRQPDFQTFHYVSDIPQPPEAFIAHPYTLLQTHKLAGRQLELNLLTDWVARPDSDIYKAHILNIVAIGGLGKSALTWKWFNEIAPQEMKPLAGRMWWSFYESDATFENFVTRTLAYVTRRPLDEVQQLPVPDREAQLLAALNHEPFLIVLDGLERILIAYSRMDAARLEDSQVGNQRNLRKTADPRVGRFLKKLAQVKNSRILVSTRLYPTELETEAEDPIPGCFRRDLAGLTNEDAIELWRAFDVTGSRDLLLPVFATFDKHPLLIQTLAGEVKRYRRAPGNFEGWLKSHKRFDPTKFPSLHDAMGHVLEFALRGLDPKVRQALQVIAAFRMPATYDTLAALLVGKSKTRYELRTGKLVTEKGKTFDEETALIAALAELEGRGLVGWDKRANRYDLHPIVRGVVWSSLSEDTRCGVYKGLYEYFAALPMVANYLKVNSLEDLTSDIELYSSLIGLQRYDDAGRLFHERFGKTMVHRLSSNRQIVELLETLFPDGLEQLPRLSSANYQGVTFNSLALGYKLGGHPGLAVPLYRRYIKISSEINDYRNLSIGLCNLSDTLRLSGALCESELAARRALTIRRTRVYRFDEAVSLALLGLALIERGIVKESELALQRALRLFMAEFKNQMEGVTKSFLAHKSLLFGEFTVAWSCANSAWELAHDMNYETDLIRAARLQGEAALRLNDFGVADERLHHALTRARMGNHVQEEVPALVVLAELQRRRGDLKSAREFLDDVWEAAERGPYLLIQADACNVLAQIERDEGNLAAAVEAATKAYRLAWCDGPPFAYHWGLEKARKHLQELGAEEPEMPPFDESKYEPMPEVEIDPEDEFHGGKIDGE